MSLQTAPTAAAASAPPVKKPHRQVITIAPGGAISGLQVKPGKGVDLRQFGEADIKRATEIEWDLRAQGWMIGVREGRYALRVVTDELAAEVGFAGAAQYPHTISECSLSGEARWMFSDYDDAVLAEIAVLDHIRLTQGPDAL